MNPLGWVQGLEGSILIAVICTLLFIEESGVPVPFAPGDLLLAIGGIAIAAGSVSPVLMPLAALVAIVTGAVLGREIFALLGWERLMKVAGPLHARMPLERASGMLERNGWRAIFAARLIPGLRVHTTQVAGVRRMPRPTFIGGLVPAAVVYVAAFVGLGAAFGRPILDLIRRVEHEALLYAVALAIVVIGGLWLRRPAQRTLASLGGWTGLFRVRLDSPGVILIPACIGLDFAGHSVAVALKLPLFLDTIGTILCALVLGPWVGGSVGFIANLVSSNTVDPIAAPFSVVSFAVGFAAGVFGRLVRWGPGRAWLALWPICFLIASVVSTPIDLLFNDGRSGVPLGDAVFAYLTGAHVPAILAAYAGEAAIDLPDKLITVGVAVLVLRGLPQRPAEPSKLEFDIGRAFVHVLRSRGWFRKVLAGAACLLFGWLLVPLLLFMGYAVAVARGARAGEPELPRWDRLGVKVKDGFLLLALLAIWNLPGIVLGIPADVAGGEDGGGATRPNAAVGVLGVLAGLWGLLVLVLQAPIWSQYVEGGFGAGFDLAAIGRRVRFNLGLTTVVAAMGIALSLLAVAGFAIVVVGALLTIPCAAWTWAHMVGTYSRITDQPLTEQALERGSP